MKQYWTTVLAISVLALSPISWLSVMDGVEAFGWKKHTERTDWTTHKMEHAHYESLKSAPRPVFWSVTVETDEDYATMREYARAELRRMMEK